MIISRLCEYALRENLVSDPAFENHAVRFLIRLDDQGNYLGVRETQGRTVQRGKREVVQPQELLIPKIGTRTSGQTACFLVDAIPRVLVGYDVKLADRLTHANFIEKLREAAKAIPHDTAIRAVLTFLETVEHTPEAMEPLKAELAEYKPKSSDWITFETDEGLVLDR